MKKTSGTHWVGVFLLFVSSILLLIVTISAPIINHVGLLRVSLTNGTTTKHSGVSFGTFGYCILDGRNGHTWCTGRHIGYEPASQMSMIDAAPYSSIKAGTADSLTKVMVLHPIACGVAFVAFLVSIGAGVSGSLAAALVAFMAWVLTLVALAVDFSLFGIVRRLVNHDGSGSHASFGSALWMLVAAFLLSFCGMVIVLFTCCSARRERARTSEERNQGSSSRRSRFGIF